MSDIFKKLRRIFKTRKNKSKINPMSKYKRKPPIPTRRRSLRRRIETKKSKIRPAEIRSAEIKIKLKPHPPKTIKKPLKRTKSKPRTRSKRTKTRSKITPKKK